MMKRLVDFNRINGLYPLFIHISTIIEQTHIIILFQIFWVSDLPPLPASRLFKTSIPTTNNNKCQTQMSKSLILMPSDRKTEEKTTQSTSKLKDSAAVTKNTNTDLKIWNSSTQLSKNSNGQPSYADYENYFYI